MKRLSMVLWLLVFSALGLSQAFAQDVVIRYERRGKHHRWGFSIPPANPYSANRAGYYGSPYGARANAYPSYGYDGRRRRGSYAPG